LPVIFKLNQQFSGSKYHTVVLF